MYENLQKTKRMIQRALINRSYFVFEKNFEILRNFINKGKAIAIKIKLQS